MRTIRKGAEPTVWLEHRSRPGAVYDDVDAPKEALRRALSKEQGGLCCYCLGRIAPAPKRMKIEHWASQHRHPHRQLDYSNLLGACRGGEGSPPSQQHCDTAKGEGDLAINPADPSRGCSALFTYLHNGKLEAAGADARVEKDIKTLALNQPRLMAGRRALIEEVASEVVRTKRSIAASKLLGMAAKLEEPDETGNLRPFCQAGVFWLTRQARKRDSGPRLG
jgi:uncharacterized protein (TIGR02646 family)